MHAVPLSVGGLQQGQKTMYESTTGEKIRPTERKSRTFGKVDADVPYSEGKQQPAEQQHPKDAQCRRLLNIN